MTALLPRHAEIMRFVQHHMALCGHAPTIVEIRQGMGLSSNSRAHAAITMLVDSGYLSRDPYRERGLTILKPIPDDRFEEAAKRVCSALGLTDPSNIKTARDEIEAALLEAA